ncbi:hypothetical protein VPHK392_0059 [Vibrio phage K392]
MFILHLITYQSSKFTHTITCAIMVNSDEAHNF